MFQILRKLISIVLLGLAFAGCQDTQGNIQTKVDKRILSTTVGKSYANYAAQRKTTLEGLFANDKAYGELFAVSPLVDGTTIYRHMDRYESSGSQSSFGRLTSKQSVNFSYRLIYFRVDDAGLVLDYANGFLNGESSSCVGWVGGIFKKCTDEAEFRFSVQQYDTLVKTSGGLAIASWGPEVAPIQ